MSFCNKFIQGNEVNNILFKAIYLGDLERVNSIIDSYGLSHCSPWAEGFDLLFTAIECQYFELAKLLIKKGCKLEEKTPESRSVVHLAVKKGNCDLIKILIEKIDNGIKKVDQGDSLLHLAVTEGREDVVRLLIALGADLAFKNCVGSSPLHLASVRGRVGILEVLLTSGANIESKDNNGKTSLFLAVSSDNKDIVKVLLKYGANCKCVSSNGLTPLLDATAKGYFEIVTDLLKYGADLNDRNKYGQSPLHIACMQKNKNMICLLLNAGADVNAVDTTGMVPSDAVVRKVSSGSIFFEDSCIAYLLWKQFLVLKTGGFSLNKKNETFYEIFYNMYCNEIIVHDEVLSQTPDILNTTIKNCECEIQKMKTSKYNSEFTIFNIFQKLKNPQVVTTEKEINFLESINLSKEFPLFKVIIQNLVENAKLKNELLKCAQEWFLFLHNNREGTVIFIPEEVVKYILSFFNIHELELLIFCGEEISKKSKIQSR